MRQVLEKYFAIIEKSIIFAFVSNETGKNCGNDRIWQMRERFVEYIRQKGMRRSAERFAVLDCVLRRPPHFKIEDLVSDFEGEFRVSRATVYNTVELLLESGLLRRHIWAGGQSVYEMSDSTHAHLVCIRCGMMKIIDSGKLGIEFGKMRIRGFAPHSATIDVYGICSQCERRSRKTGGREGNSAGKGNVETESKVY